jgi:aspartate dehydrogenase
MIRHFGMIGFGAIARGMIDVVAHHISTPFAQLTIFVRAGREADVVRSLRDYDGRLAHKIDVISAPSVLYKSGCDYVVECAGHDAVRDHIAPLLRAGADVILASAGALADDGCHDMLRVAARAGKSQIILSTGAIGGLDLLRAASLAGLYRVHYTSCKPARAWHGTPAQDLIALDQLEAPTPFFEGTARQAAHIYTKNANVAALVALAGLGFDDTRVTLIADPAATENTHHIAFEGASCHAHFSIAGQPHPLNPKTSLTTVYALADEVIRRHEAVSV